MTTETVDVADESVAMKLHAPTQHFLKHHAGNLTLGTDKDTGKTVLQRLHRRRFDLANAAGLFEREDFTHIFERFCKALYAYRVWTRAEKAGHHGADQAGEDGLPLRSVYARLQAFVTPQELDVLKELAAELPAHPPYAGLHDCERCVQQHGILWRAQQAAIMENKRRLYVAALRQLERALYLVRQNWKRECEEKQAVLEAWQSLPEGKRQSKDVAKRTGLEKKRVDAHLFTLRQEGQAGHD